MWIIAAWTPEQRMEAGLNEPLLSSSPIYSPLL